jgi:hypothetical protein
MTILINETITEEKAGFLLSMAHSVAGGRPSIGFDPQHNDYIVISTCECKACKNFMESYNLQANTSVVLAIKAYVDARIKFIEEGEMKNETKH